MELREIDDRDKLQFDYAWKSFESHQKQTLKAKFFKHKWWIRGMQLVVALCFSVAVIRAIIG